MWDEHLVVVRISRVSRTRQFQAMLQRVHE
jgi:hypothetical protein